MARKPAVKFTANFERNLEGIAQFLAEVGAPQAFDALLDELLETVIPNLERFPEMGRPFLARLPRSVETTNALAALRTRLSALTPDMDALREYILKDHLLLYAPIDGAIYLLAIRHQRQLTFDFDANWGR
jgi:plasmid stabilization system protein ParE